MLAPYIRRYLEGSAWDVEEPASHRRNHIRQIVSKQTTSIIFGEGQPTRRVLGVQGQAVRWNQTMTSEMRTRPR